MKDFTTALAHEIKNPAAVALAHVNMLRLDGEDEDLTHHLNHIENALTNICDLVRDMLAATQDRSELYDVDLGRILADILEIYRAAWPDISINFNENELLFCLGHETSLRIIFSNLIKNAVEALEGREGGVIEIFARGGDEGLVVTVSDNGNIDQAREKPHGNGLGLAICRNLANGLGADFCATPLETGGLAVTVKLRTVSPAFA
ncbi:MAG: HAMP domain-containing histidine kinase [Defluviitaleaceae bacterium]|nr:HAMP domain-containing histidine kinase [Defluviitaleaceae bacterium]